MIELNRDVLAAKRNTAIKDGNLIMAAFAASQIPGHEKLNEIELKSIKENLIKKDGTPRIQLMTLCFVANKEQAWTALQKELTALMDSLQYNNAVIALRLLKNLSKHFFKSNFRYKRIISDLPKQYFATNSIVSNFEDYWLKEINKLYPGHDDRVKYFSDQYFSFVEQGLVPERFLFTVVNSLRDFQIGSIIDLKHQLTELAISLGAEVK